MARREGANRVEALVAVLDTQPAGVQTLAEAELLVGQVSERNGALATSRR